jgi:hypothetical protein
LTLFGFDTCMQSFDTDCDVGRRSARLQLGISGGTSATFNPTTLRCVDTRGVNFLTLTSPLGLVFTPPKILTTAVGTCAILPFSGFECDPVANAAIAVDVTVCCRSYSSALLIGVGGDREQCSPTDP